MLVASLAPISQHRDRDTGGHDRNYAFSFFLRVLTASEALRHPNEAERMAWVQTTVMRFATRCSRRKGNGEHGSLLIRFVSEEAGAIHEAA